MGIDRKAFYALATAMLLGPTGCIVQPNQPPANTPAGNTAQPQPAGNDDGCVAWDAAGECTQWQPTAEGGSADGCVEWDPSGECVQWADYGSNMPADECVEWDPSGECISWANQGGGGPADECIDWNPSGECISWMPANEQW